jgi:hypothetical protein
MNINFYLIQMDPATHVVTKHIITVVSTLYYTYIILTKTCKILHDWYHNICMFIVTYFIVVCFEEMAVYAPWRWRDNRAENVGTM